jgi:hypothetical protein
LPSLRTTTAPGASSPIAASVPSVEALSTTTSSSSPPSCAASAGSAAVTAARLL